MTKRHFVRAAQLIAMNPSRTDRIIIADFCVDLFFRFNTKFDEQKFRKACGL